MFLKLIEPRPHGCLVEPGAPRGLPNTALFSHQKEQAQCLPRSAR